MDGTNSKLVNKRVSLKGLGGGLMENVLDYLKRFKLSYTTTEFHNEYQSDLRSALLQCLDELEI